MATLDAAHVDVSELPNTPAPEATKDAQAKSHAKPKAPKPRPQPVEEEPESAACI